MTLPNLAGEKAKGEPGLGNVDFCVAYIILYDRDTEARCGQALPEQAGGAVNKPGSPGLCL